MTIYKFAKLSFLEKKQLIESKAVFLDNYMDSENLINTYFFDGFFVEAIMNLSSATIIEIIPFLHGYKIDKKNVNSYLRMAS